MTLLLVFARSLTDRVGIDYFAGRTDLGYRFLSYLREGSCLQLWALGRYFVLERTTD